jgi:hypothetical protein
MDVRAPTHYYDTYAYSDLRDHKYASVHRFCCMLRTCEECAVRGRRLHSKLLHTSTHALYDVGSAFAGVAALRPEAMLQSAWHSDNNHCEHIHFCKSMRVKNFRVVLLPRCHAQWMATFDLFAKPKNQKYTMQMLDAHVDPKYFRKFVKFLHPESINTEDGSKCRTK